MSDLDALREAVVEAEAALRNAIAESKVADAATSAARLAVFKADNRLKWAKQTLSEALDTRPKTTLFDVLFFKPNGSFYAQEGVAVLRDAPDARFALRNHPDVVRLTDQGLFAFALMDEYDNGFPLLMLPTAKPEV